jgi:hypothetical protein
MHDPPALANLGNGWNIGAGRATGGLLVHREVLRYWDPAGKFQTP